MKLSNAMVLSDCMHNHAVCYRAVSIINVNFYMRCSVLPNILMVTVIVNLVITDILIPIFPSLLISLDSISPNTALTTATQTFGKNANSFNVKMSRILENKKPHE